MAELSPISLSQIANQIARLTRDDGIIIREELEAAGLSGEDVDEALSYDLNHNGLDPQEFIEFLDRKASVTLFQLQIEEVDYRVIPNSKKSAREVVMLGTDLAEQYFDTFECLEAEESDETRRALAFLFYDLMQLSDPTQLSIPDNLDGAADALTENLEEFTDLLVSEAMRKHLLDSLMMMLCEALVIHLEDPALKAQFDQNLRQNLARELGHAPDEEKIATAESVISHCCTLNRQALFNAVTNSHLKPYLLVYISTLFEFLPDQNERQFAATVRKIFSPATIQLDDLENFKSALTYPECPENFHSVLLYDKPLSRADLTWDQNEYVMLQNQYEEILSDLEITLAAASQQEIPLEALQVSNEQREAFYRQQLINKTDSYLATLTEACGGSLPHDFTNLYLNDSARFLNIRALPEMSYDPGSTAFQSESRHAGLGASADGATGGIVGFTNYIDPLRSKTVWLVAKLHHQKTPEDLFYYRTLLSQLDDIQIILDARARRVGAANATANFARIAGQLITPCENETARVTAFLQEQNDLLSDARQNIVNAEQAFLEGDYDTAESFMEAACLRLQRYQNRTGRSLYPLSPANEALAIARTSGPLIVSSHEAGRDILEPIWMRALTNQKRKFIRAAELALVDLDCELDTFSELLELWQEYNQALNTYRKKTELFEADEISNAELTEAETTANQTLIEIAPRLADLYYYLQFQRGSGADLRDRSVAYKHHAAILSTRPVIIEERFAMSHYYQLQHYAGRPLDAAGAALRDNPSNTVAFVRARDTDLRTNQIYLLGKFEWLLETFFYDPNGSNSCQPIRQEVDQAFQMVREFNSQEFDQAAFNAERIKELTRLFKSTIIKMQPRERQAFIAALPRAEWQQLFEMAPILSFYFKASGLYVD